MSKGIITLMTNNFDITSTLEPQGISLLSAIAQQKGFKVHLVEPSIKGLTYEQTVDIVDILNPDYLGVSIIHHQNINKTIHFIDRYKTLHPNCVVFLGGFAVTQYCTDPEYHEIISKVDFFFKGESEVSFASFLDTIERKANVYNIDGIGYMVNNDIVINKNSHVIESLDSLPDQDRAILCQLLEEYPTLAEASISVGRGCDRRCSFCIYAGMALKHNDFNYKHRYRSASRIFCEMQKLYDMGIREFTLEDENLFEFGSEFKDNVLELYELIKKSFNNIRLISWARVDSIDYDLLHKFHQIGLHELYVGVDSFYDQDLKLFNKGYLESIR